MAGSPLAAHNASPAELKARADAERAGGAFLLYVDGQGSQQIRRLDAASARRLTMGRHPSVDVLLGWDDRVSSVHAELEPLGDGWALVDDGLSLNGSFVNGERVIGRRRLRDGDAVRLGDTIIAYCSPADSGSRTTIAAGSWPAEARVTDSQRRVLVALCRPLKAHGSQGVPATNQEIAEELSLSVNGVKTHLRVLFAKFGLDELQPNQKRVRLAQLALQTGVITERDLEPG